MIYVGIDAGGTKTQVRIADEGGRLLGSGSGGPGNWQVAKEEGFLAAVTDAYRQAMASAGLRMDSPIAGMTAGVAGVGRPAEERRAAEALERNFPGVKVDVVNDAVIALAAGTLGEPGAVVIAGTGSIAWALDPEGKAVRAGGWGYLLGDEGSGYFVGLEGIKAALKDRDGTGPRTALAGRLVSELGLAEPEDFVAFAYQEKLPRERIAALARAVLDEGRKGDRVAREIASSAVAHLVHLCAAVACRARLNGNFPLVTAGGLFSDRSFSGLFTERLGAHLPAARPVRSVLDPAAGACALALGSAGRLDEEAKAALLGSIARRDSYVDS